MAVIDTIITEIKKLVVQGQNLQLPLRDDKDGFGQLRLDYESWYTKSLAVVQQVIPERVVDFKEAYKTDKLRGKNIQESFTISGYFIGQFDSVVDKLYFNIDQAYNARLAKQVAILSATSDAASSALRDIRTELHSELLDSDVESANELLKTKHLRSAGVVCGVALEAHLKSVLKRHSITLRKKKPALGDLNETLKTAKVYDTPTWRLIQRLADIRNLCAHSRDREPTKSEVEDLIRGTEKVVKEIF